MEINWVWGNKLKMEEKENWKNKSIRISKDLQGYNLEYNFSSEDNFFYLNQGTKTVENYEKLMKEIFNIFYDLKVYHGKIPERVYLKTIEKNKKIKRAGKKIQIEPVEENILKDLKKEINNKCGRLEVIIK